MNSPNKSQIALLAAGLILAAADTASAQQSQSLFGIDAASVSFGPYARVELGGSIPSLSDAYWLPPGAADPRINFDASGDATGFGALAFGFDFQNGLRADLSIFATGESGVTAPCASASNGTACSTHADIAGATVASRGMMANLFYSPLESQGSVARLQPFVVAGLGFAQNDVGDWTRENPGATQQFRTFEGDTTTDVAWSVGIGASYQLSKPGDRPVILEASWRYYDFGTASGGSAPLAGNGSSSPREPFSFRNTSQVIAVGVRIPLQRF